MKKGIILISMLLASNGFADNLHNYNDIKTAVTNGKAIHVVIDFTQCTPSSKNIPLASFGMAFTPSELNITDHIAGSLMHFTLNDPAFPNKAIYEFARYTFTSDNNLTFTYQSLDSATYTPLDGKTTFTCKIDAGAKIYS